MTENNKTDTQALSPPDFLREKGIERVTDNTEGREIVLPEGMLFLFFGEELKERFLRESPACPSSSG